MSSYLCGCHNSMSGKFLSCLTYVVPGIQLIQLHGLAKRSFRQIFAQFRKDRQLNKFRLLWRVGNSCFSTSFPSCRVNAYVTNWPENVSNWPKKHSRIQLALRASVSVNILVSGVFGFFDFRAFVSRLLFLNNSVQPSSRVCGTIGKNWLRGVILSCWIL